MEEKKKYSLFSRMLFGLLVLVLTLPLVGAYLTLLVNPAKMWHITVFGILYIPLLLIALVLLLSAVRRRSMMTWMLLVLLPSVFLAGRCIQLRGSKEPEGPLKIVTYNVGLFAHGQKHMAEAPRLEIADSVVSFLRRTGADIICLQEFGLPTGIDMDDYLRTHFPGYQAEYYVLTGSKIFSGNVTLSRLPVVRKGKIDFDNSTNMALYTDIRLDSVTVRIYNCHFESYNLSPETVIRAIETDEEALETAESKMKRSIRKRPEQVGKVLESIRECPVHAMVAGDFNDVPFSYTYQRLISSRKDSFVKAGKGFSPTYVQFRPFLRIDYLLYPEELEACTYKTEKVHYSDHYPVIATYR